MRSFLAVLLLASLSFSVWAENICVGDKVIRIHSGSHYKVKVEQIYNDKTALISYDAGYSNETVPLSQLSFPLETLNGFTVGDKAVRIHSGSHYHVNILSLYSDKQVEISYDAGYGNETVPVEQLSRKLATLRGFEVGSEMIRIKKGSHYKVKVKAIYKDETVLISYDAHYSDEVVPARELSFPLRSFENFEIGSDLIRIKNGSHYKVKVLNIFTDRMVEISYDARYGDEVVPAKELSFPLQTLNDFFVGSKLVRIKNGSYYNVKVLTIYKDEMVEISYDARYSDEAVPASELSLPLTNFDGIEVGDKLVRTKNASHYDVKVLAIYKDGKISIAYDAGYGDEVVPAKELSRARKCYFDCLNNLNTINK